MRKNEKKTPSEPLRERQDSPYAVEIRDLSVEYRTSKAVVRAVNGINLKLRKKTTLGLVGETGAGKTTAMLALMQLIPEPPGVITQGSIHVNGLNVLELSAREISDIRGKEIAMIFQDPMTSLNPVMSVGSQIQESILLHESVSRQEAWERAKKMLEVVGIDPARAGEYPHQFSGGMRQRVGIAIALACHPLVLIADEPTTALDVTIQAQVLKLMRQLIRDYDTSMILITHDLGVVAETCDNVAVMYAGHIVEQGTLEEVFHHTKHPYTEGLFNSLPNIHNRVQKLTPIPGLMPDPSKLPEGCPFAPRCAYAVEACRRCRPEPVAFSDTHEAACSRYREPNFKIAREG
ncbi:MAG: ABC transporter ATP-binding protein [Faecousia sp.]